MSFLIFLFVFVIESVISLDCQCKSLEFNYQNCFLLQEIFGQTSQCDK